MHNCHGFAPAVAEAVPIGFAVPAVPVTVSDSVVSVHQTDCSATAAGYPAA